MSDEDQRRKAALSFILTDHTEATLKAVQERGRLTAQAYEKELLKRMLGSTKAMNDQRTLERLVNAVGRINEHGFTVSLRVQEAGGVRSLRVNATEESLQPQRFGLEVSCHLDTAALVLGVENMANQCHKHRRGKLYYHDKVVEAGKFLAATNGFQSINRAEALEELRQLWLARERRFAWGTRRVARRMAFRCLTKALDKLSPGQVQERLQMGKEADWKGLFELEAKQEAGFNPIALWILSALVQALLPVFIEWLWSRNRAAESTNGIAVVGPAETEKEFAKWNG